MRQVRSDLPTPDLLDLCHKVWGPAPRAVRVLDNVKYEIDFYFLKLQRQFWVELGEEPAQEALNERLRSSVTRNRERKERERREREERERRDRKQ
jgi:hypothetical protein